VCVCVCVCVCVWIVRGSIVERGQSSACSTRPSALSSSDGAAQAAGSWLLHSVGTAQQEGWAEAISHLLVLEESYQVGVRTDERRLRV
jgi:hypothetical protein